MVFGVTFYVALAIFVMICVIALIAILGWVSEGARREASDHEIKRLEYENKELREANTRLVRRNNIAVANEYAKEKK